MILYSRLCKSIIIIQFFITNYKHKYFCGHWWNLTSAANNIYTYVSYLVLNRIITCMLQLVKYYYKTPFAANLDQKISSCYQTYGPGSSWESAEFTWYERPRQSGCAGATRRPATFSLHGRIFSWCWRGCPINGLHQFAPGSSPLWGEPGWGWLAVPAGTVPGPHAGQGWASRDPAAGRDLSASSDTILMRIGGESALDI